MLSQLGIRKLCSRFVPRFLTAEMRAARKAACRQNLDTFVHSGRASMANIITMDETSLSLYTPESKRESAEWKLPGEKPSKKLKCAKTSKKCLMLSVFWKQTGVIKMDFTGDNINAAYYCQLLEDVRRTQRKPRNDNLWIQHDNAPVHTAHQTIEKMAGLDLHAVAHPPYSPDLAPSDFYLFNRLKKHLRGTRFDSPQDLRLATEEFFANLDDNFFQTAFQELVQRWRKCYDADGDYIEK